MAEKTVRGNIKEMIDEVAARFAASPESKKVMQNASKGNRLKDILSGSRVSAMNKHIKALSEKASPADILDARKTRNNELAKTIAAYSLPIAGVSSIGVGAYKIHKKRKDEKNMEKLSAQQYEELVEKLAEEIIEEDYEENEDVVDEDYEEDDVDGFEEEDIAKRAYAAYEAAQMQKEAAENNYDVASAYEEAALAAMEELGLFED